MNIEKSIKQILSMNNNYEKELKIEELSDNIEYSKNIQNEDLIKGISLLLEYGLKLNKGTLKETVFSTIFTSVLNHEIAPKINWDNLSDILFNLDEECLDYSLSFLGFSHNKKYIDIISKCLVSSSSDIKESAEEALNEINSHTA